MSTSSGDPTSRGGGSPSGDLELEQIHIAFTGTAGEVITIAEDLSLYAGKGAPFCIIGRSGSGKTSLLRAAAGLRRPDGGSVRWFGIDVSTMTENQIRDARRTRIGYSDQASVMIPDLTAVENVLIPLLPDGPRTVRRERPHAEDLLDQLGLSARHHHFPHQMSGGERQRVSLARALVHSPDILITDEPTASLDRKTADSIIDVLIQYAQDHTVLVASHDPHLAAAATRTLTLEQELAPASPTS